MKAILDANIIISDFRLDSPASMILREATEKGNLELFIPEIVLDEVYNKFEELLLEAKSKIEKEKNIIKRLTKKDIEDNFSYEVKTSLQEYKDYLKNYFRILVYKF